MIILSLLLGLASSWAMTAGARRLAIKAELLDHPNSRSSHSIPTPRGGGVAIVISFTAIMLGLNLAGYVPGTFTAALMGSGLTVAFIGFVDDQRPIPARWRLLAHIAAAIWTIFVLGGIPPVPMLGVAVDLGWFGLALATVYVVWMVNLCNFMDGIDGIASIEAITVALGGALCWWLATSTPHWFIPVAFAACVVGFLIWNYPPARIFMGDSGSGFIGLVLGLFSLWTAQEVPQVFWCWFILLGVFMVDATTTLVRRFRLGEKIDEAHRSHAYQYASRRLGSHLRVSLGVAVINLLWLLPLAVLVAMRQLDGVIGGVLAYTPLVWLALRYQAGVRHAQGA